MCMMTILPTTLMRMEAFHGSSRLQNYEAIMRNRPWSSQVGWVWKVIIVCVAALPVGLSVLYKRYLGEATIHIVAGNDWYNDIFGVYPPPGLLPLGYNSGLALMFNVTMPFMMGSTNQTAPRDHATTRLLDHDDEIPLPAKYPETYGFNTLLLNATSAAFLDAPRSSWVVDMQTRLKDAEYVDVSACVLAVLVSKNDSIDAHREEPIASPFWTELSSEMTGSARGPYYNLGVESWKLGFSTNEVATAEGKTNRAWSVLTMQPTDSSTDFTHWAIKWDVTRNYCQGTWRISRAGMELTRGECSESIHATNVPSSQNPDLPLLWLGSRFALSDTFGSLFSEFLGPFQGEYVSSHWLSPSMAVNVAGSYWARMAVTLGPGSPHWNGDESFALSLIAQNKTASGTTDGLKYKRSPTITSTKPALGRSFGLYCVLVIQPLATIGALVFGLALWRVPVGRGFGLVTLLAGIDARTLDLLKGASLSGTLQQPMFVAIRPSTTASGEKHIVYQIAKVQPQRPIDLALSSVYR
ncbi:hypothetical protein KC315_g10836 [Hortaea werneckii]|nr:hypothetical protein KC315_g10836 [Hortaea werneckii]